MEGTLEDADTRKPETAIVARLLGHSPHER